MHYWQGAAHAPSAAVPKAIDLEQRQWITSVCARAITGANCHVQPPEGDHDKLLAVEVSISWAPVPVPFFSSKGAPFPKFRHAVPVGFDGRARLAQSPMPEGYGGLSHWHWLILGVHFAVGVGGGIGLLRPYPEVYAGLFSATSLVATAALLHGSSVDVLKALLYQPSTYGSAIATLMCSAGTFLLLTAHPLLPVMALLLLMVAFVCHMIAAVILQDSIPWPRLAKGLASIGALICVGLVITSLGVFWVEVLAVLITDPLRLFVGAALAFGGAALLAWTALRSATGFLLLGRDFGSIVFEGAWEAVGPVTPLPDEHSLGEISYVSPAPDSPRSSAYIVEASDVSEGSDYEEPLPRPMPHCGHLPIGPYSVAVGRSPIHNRGVFARRAFSKGEVVEVCPFLYLKSSDIKGLIRDYTFEGTHKGMEILLLGNGSLYNSRDDYNLDTDHNTNAFWMTANRNIENGEELLIDYGPNWFVERGYARK